MTKGSSLTCRERISAVSSVRRRVSRSARTANRPAPVRTKACGSGATGAVCSSRATAPARIMSVGTEKAGGAGAEDLDAVLGHAYGVLALGRQGLVAGHGGPAVGQYLHVRLAEVHHRLDGEAHAGLEHGAFALAAIVEDV